METNLAENLRWIMFLRKMKVAALSEASGVPETRIYELLRGKVLNPRINTVMKLAAALDVTMMQLLGMDKVVNG